MPCTSCTEHQAARQGRPGCWTCDDLEAARWFANQVHRPWGHRGPTPREVWDQRLPITATERAAFGRSLDQHRETVRLAERYTPGRNPGPTGPGQSRSCGYPPCSRRARLPYFHPEVNYSTNYGSFCCKNFVSGTVLVKYTYTGDANLSGAVDGDDYTYWLNGFLGTTTRVDPGLAPRRLRLQRRDRRRRLHAVAEQLPVRRPAADRRRPEPRAGAGDVAAAGARRCYLRRLLLETASTTNDSERPSRLRHKASIADKVPLRGAA